MESCPPQPKGGGILKKANVNERTSSFPDLQQGFTQIPNYFLDHIAPELSQTELRVMLYIYRHTLGYQKLADTICYEQFLNGVVTNDGRRVDQGAKVSRRALVPALAALEARGLISRQQLGRYAPVRITLRPVAPPPAHAEVPAVVAQVQEEPASAAQASAPPVEQAAHQQVQNLPVPAVQQVQKIHLMQKKESKPKEKTHRVEAAINQEEEKSLEEIRENIPGISQQEVMRLFAIAKSRGRDLAYLFRIMRYVVLCDNIRVPAAVFTALVTQDLDRTPAPPAKHNSSRPALARKGPIDFDKYTTGKYAHLIASASAGPTMD
jgi:hypothetical protein